jgi:hypothetical protein
MMVGLTTVACVLTMAACGGSAPSSSSSQGAQSTGTSPPPGPSDARICQVVSQATTAYNSKNFSAWRSDLALVGAAADSAQYVPLKTYAEEVKQATSSTTTTTKPRSKSRHSAGGIHTSGLFNELGAYVGLQHVCAKLPSQ